MNLRILVSKTLSASWLKVNDNDHKHTSKLVMTLIKQANIKLKLNIKLKVPMDAYLRPEHRRCLETQYIGVEIK